VLFDNVKVLPGFGQQVWFAELSL